MYISIEPTLITTIVTAVGALVTIALIVIKVRKRKIIFQDGDRKVHIEGHSFPEALEIIKQIKINSERQINYSSRKQIESKDD
jgi:hypothetical protein